MTNEQDNNKYDHQSIEKKWQEKWETDSVYKTEDAVDGKENDYTLVEFAYPSGNLHIGHWYAYAIPDIYVRYRRMLGYNTLYPFGFDSFGLPAENAAIKRGLDPRKWTYENIDYMRNQLRSMGTTFDWSREVVTSDPEYYKWNQYIFGEFFKNDIAYRSETEANWCDGCKTVLANEQVEAGQCERCKGVVSKKVMKGWSLRITDFADDLIDDLDGLNWPEHIKDAQRNWIGRSEGSELSFAIKGREEKIDVFTTRADTLYGVTYVTLAPEHELVEQLMESCENKDEVLQYVKDTQAKTERDRLEGKEKTGVEMKGVSAINPANGEEVPVWVADYVLAGYGTGAVMAVPAHDERDFEFATKFGLPIKQVVSKKVGNHNKIDRKRTAVYGVIRDKEGKYLIQKFTKVKNYWWPGGGVKEDEVLEEALHREIKEETGYSEFEIGNKITEVVYDYDHKTRDERGRSQCIFYEVNLLSDKKIKVNLEDDEIEDGSTFDWISKDGLFKEIWKLDEARASVIEAPIKILEGEAFVAEGILFSSGEFEGMKSENAKKAITEKVGGKMTNTYRLRDWSVARQRYWGTPIPIVYDPEGKAHSVPLEHLPWTLPDDVDHNPDGTAPLARSEELKKRTTDIFGEGWTPETETFDTFVDSSWYFLRYLDNKNESEFASADRMKKWMPVNLYMGGAEHTTMHVLYSRFWVKAMHKLGMLPFNEPYTTRINRGLVLGPDGNKMSKSSGNVVDPDPQVEKFGTDTVRVYLGFMGPYTGANYPWNPDSVTGVRKFLDRVWRLQEKISDETSSETKKQLHKTIKKVGDDYSVYKFNTAISALMILLNTMEKNSFTKSDLETLLKILAPLAPHLSEEMWHLLGNDDYIVSQTWPEYDADLAKDNEITIGIQINGKVRGDISVANDEGEESVMTRVREMESMEKWLEGDVKKIIYKPGKILNIIVN